MTVHWSLEPQKPRMMRGAARMMGNFAAASAIDQDDGLRNQDDGQDDDQDDKPKKIDQQHKNIVNKNLSSWSVG